MPPPVRTPSRRQGGADDSSAAAAARHDYVEAAAQLRVQVVNLSAAFHKETDVSVGAQARPLAAALERLATDVAAFRTLVDAALESPTEVRTGAEADVGDDVSPPRVDATKPRPAGPATGGVTLASLSRRYNLGVDELRRLNPHLADFRANDPLPRSTAVTLRESMSPVRKRSVTPAKSPGASRREAPPSVASSTPAAKRDTAAQSSPPSAAPTESSRRKAVAPQPVRTTRTPEPEPSPAPEDTIRIVAGVHGISVNELLRANPEALEPFGLDDPLPPNLELVIPAGRRVEDCVFTNPGDTLETLSVDLRLPISVLRGANDELHDFAIEEALPPGMRVVLPPVRGPLRGDGPPPPPKPAEQRQQRKPSRRQPYRGEPTTTDDETGGSWTPRSSSSADDQYDDRDYGHGRHSPGGRTAVIRLRAPTALLDIAADHDTTVSVLLELNAHRGFDNVSPDFRFPAGTYMTVPMLR